MENRLYFIHNSTYIFKDPIIQNYYRTLDYGKHIRMAVKNWNDAVDNENKFGRNSNVHFTETNDRSKAAIVFEVEEYGTSVG
ncbi:hypothetical protein [Gorillibacterium sp. CAU 1737]|uniref:hypothetical protein n=1 Tax=Gorillibacterium sp. CAU 1737 TaxID=3140362 RepID=UPI003261004C